MTALLYDWMGCATIVGDARVSGPVINIPSPWAANSTPVYTGQIVDPYGNGIPASAFSSLTLSIADTLSGAIINDVSGVNILNTGRGAIDSQGNLKITLETGDTSMSEVPGQAQIQRSLVIDWIYDWVSPPSPIPASSGTGRHQANFLLYALVAP